MGRRVVADGARRRAGARPDEVDVRGADAPRPREVLPPAAVAQAFFTIAAAHAVRMLRGGGGAPPAQGSATQGRGFSTAEPNVCASTASAVNDASVRFPPSARTSSRPTDKTQPKPAAAARWWQSFKTQFWP